MVTDLSERNMIMLFTEALTEPIQGWVKSYKPSTLQDAISRAKDLQDSILKNRSHSRPTFQLGTRIRNLSSRTYRRKHGQTMTLGIT